jgi:hypothetical protein
VGCRAPCAAVLGPKTVGDGPGNPLVTAQDHFATRPAPAQNGLGKAMEQAACSPIVFYSARPNARPDQGLLCRPDEGQGSYTVREPFSATGERTRVWEAKTSLAWGRAWL